jgi:hypothetical protein
MGQQVAQLHERYMMMMKLCSETQTHIKNLEKYKFFLKGS